MEKDLILLVLAAGMGSRYGSLKQIDPIGPSGEFLLDYSIYDASILGFKKIVFVIKEENYEIFKETVGKRIPSSIKVEYAFQNNSNVDEKYDLKDRVKPLGTAHALLCAKDKLDCDFVVINSDDFYGRNSFKVIKEYMDTNKSNECSIVGYKVKNAISENGSVKRGVIKSSNSYLEKIDECIIDSSENYEATLLDDATKKVNVNCDTLVSMNMIGFSKESLDILEDEFDIFLEKNKEDLSSAEFLLPSVMMSLINKYGYTFKVLETNEEWFGVTYKEDREKVVEKLNNLIKEGVYENELWKNYK